MIDRHTHAGSGDPGLASIETTPTGRAETRIEPDVSASFAPTIQRLADEVAELQQRNGRVAAWFGRWRNPMRSWFNRRASVPRTEVDDLAQEVFLRLLRYSDDTIIDNPQGYLFRIAANVANEWRDRSKARQSHERSWLDELQIDPAAQPDNVDFQCRINKHLQDAVNQLPERQREVLLLHVNEGLTYKQIAERLDVTYRIVLRDLTRAYGALRVQLKAEDL